MRLRTVSPQAVIAFSSVMTLSSLSVVTASLTGSLRVVAGGTVPVAGVPDGEVVTAGMALAMATKMKVLYVSGEESEHQIKSRGDRLGVGQAPLYLLSETCIERILEEIARLKPSLVIVDSVQTVWSSKFQSAPGSVGLAAAE